MSLCRIGTHAYRICGEPEHPQHKILVNVQSYMVRQNLFDFLHQARHRFASTWLWIDAVCIDQNTTIEQNHQVRLMSEIYSKAKLVVIWLGIGSRDIVKLFELISSLPEPTSIHDDGYFRWSPVARRIRNHIVALKTCEDVSNLECWQRAWIVQETCLNHRRSVICGGVTCPWSDFYGCIDVVRADTFLERVFALT